MAHVFCKRRTYNILQWRHNERDGVSNHQPRHCLLKRLFRMRSKKISKLCVTGLYEGNSPVTGEFPAQRASNAENVPFDHVIVTLEDIIFTEIIQFLLASVVHYQLLTLHTIPWWHHGTLSALQVLCKGNQLVTSSQRAAVRSFGVLKQWRCQWFETLWFWCDFTVITAYMCPANDGRRYNVTSSLCGWEHKQNDPWIAQITIDENKANRVKTTITTYNQRKENIYNIYRNSTKTDDWINETMNIFSAPHQPFTATKRSALGPKGSGNKKHLTPYKLIFFLANIRCSTWLIMVCFNLIHWWQVPLLLTWINFNHSMDKYLTCPVKRGMKSPIHSQTSTVAPLKFGNG